MRETRRIPRLNDDRTTSSGIRSSAPRGRGADVELVLRQQRVDHAAAVRRWVRARVVPHRRGPPPGRAPVRRRHEGVGPRARPRDRHLRGVLRHPARARRRLGVRELRLHPAGHDRGGRRRRGPLPRHSGTARRRRGAHAAVARRLHARGHRDRLPAAGGGPPPRRERRRGRRVRGATPPDRGATRRRAGRVQPGARHVRHVHRVASCSHRRHGPGAAAAVLARDLGGRRRERGAHRLHRRAKRPAPPADGGTPRPVHRPRDLRDRRHGPPLRGRDLGGVPGAYERVLEQIIDNPD